RPRAPLSQLGGVLSPVNNRSRGRVLLHQVDGVLSACLAPVHLRPPDELVVVAPEMRPDASGRGVDGENRHLPFLLLTIPPVAARTASIDRGLRESLGSGPDVIRVPYTPGRACSQPLGAVLLLTMAA